MLNNHVPTENVDGRDVETVERQYWVEMRRALDKLETMDEFKKVILDGYFKDKAVNGVSLLATDYIVNAGLRTRVMESLVAISQLEDFFNTIRSLGAEETESFDDGEE